LAAQKIDIPTAFVGSQIGPFKTWLGARLFDRVAAKAAGIFPRDEVSEAEVLGRVAHSRCIRIPDSAFALKLPAADVKELLRRYGADIGVATLALVISSELYPPDSRDSHVALFSEIAARLVESGLIAQVIVVVQHDQDRSISRQLAQSLRLEARRVIDDDLDP